MSTPATTMPSAEYLTAPQIAALLELSSETVYRMARSGVLSSYRVGNGRGLVRFPLDGFRAYLAANHLPAALAGHI
ncbi:helix-turn-helix domain-containing protein [Kitasatospora sp. NPDC002040]|uniref:helix-turn-helix domain-containing protein n=1 Tax=Kitasatospora sp. NPDC002040 TaxID=3154661 RepID=UPI00332C8FD5